MSITYNQNASCVILTWKTPASKALGPQQGEAAHITRVQYWVTDDMSNLRQGEAKAIAANLSQLDKVGEVPAFMHTEYQAEQQADQVQTQPLADFLNLGKHLN